MKGLASLDVPTAYDRNSPCNDKLNYIPDLDHLNHTPIRYIRINFHFMLSEKGEGNFTGEEGVAFAHKVVREANLNLRKNKKMNLPPGNVTPVIPQRYQYVITPRPNVPDDRGVYYHYDDELYWMVGKIGPHRNIFKKEVFEKYGIQKDTVLNVFVMATHPDSLKSPTFHVENRGIAFGNWVKMGGWYNLCVDTNGNAINVGRYSVTKNLHHEIGHCLGLRHTWRGNDGCDDTPKNPGCWNKSSTPPCDVNWSNNIMDYNAHQSSWSPCQVGTTHYTMTNKKRKMRKMLESRWCVLKEDKKIAIEENIVWNGEKDLEGHLIIKDDATLTIRCRVSLPQAAKIIVYPKGQLILDGATLENDCGDQWKGIEVWSFGRNQGTVQFFNSPTIRNVENEITWVED
ncbi:MAG: M43 family zinc metalloprotease [Bacteroidota bacterium]